MKEYDVYEHIATGQRTEPLRVLFTFKWSNFLHLVVPSRMLQLYTINVLIEQSSVGAAYVLMANKAQMTYNRVLNALHQSIQQPPLSVILDFEIGMCE